MEHIFPTRGETIGNRLGRALGDVFPTREGEPEVVRFGRVWPMLPEEIKPVARMIVDGTNPASKVDGFRH